jgi:hypothetical protein
LNAKRIHQGGYKDLENEETMISRTYNIYFFSLVILIIGVMAFIIYRHNAPRPGFRSDSGMVLSPQTKENRVHIRGLQFSGYNEGEKVISIKADRFTVEKKKIGFLTTSLFNVANLKNAIIDIYGQGGVSEKGAVTGIEEQLSGVTFKDTFSKDALPGISQKAIASITIQPVSVNLYIGNANVARISASSANIRVKQRDIVFQGDVKVISGEKTLFTERLSFLPEEAIINTGGHFVLKTKEGRLEGQQLSADIFFRSIDVRNGPKEKM